MKSQPNSPNPKRDLSENDGRIAIDIYIMLAVLVVLMLTALAQMITLIKAFSFLTNIMHSLLIIAVIGCGLIAGWRTITTTQPTRRRSMSMSAAIGSLLAGVFTTASATTALASGGFIFLAGIFVFIALCLIGLLALFILPEEKTTSLPSEASTYTPPANKADPIQPKNSSARQAPVSAAKTPSPPSPKPHTPSPTYSGASPQPKRVPPPHPAIPPAYNDIPSPKPFIPPAYNNTPLPQPKPVIPPPYNDVPPQPAFRSGQNNAISPSQLPPEESELDSSIDPNPSLREKPAIPIPIPVENTTRSRGPLNIMPTETPTLPPLFEGDKLYQLPKTGERFFFSIKSNDVAENYEDAASISGDNARFALSDGVSSSYFVRPWARLLTSHWVANPLLTDDVTIVENWLQAPRSHWQQWVKQTWLPKINERNRSLGRPEFTVAEVTHYIEQGANATFLGVSLDRKALSWKALAVGDTCLFQLYQEENKQWDYITFPLKHSNDFSDAPASITSSKNDAAFIANNIKLKNGFYREGDILLLTTDAMAEWIFIQLERQKSGDIVHFLNNLNNEVFSKFVDQERSQRRLKDDDTSLIIVRL